ncbi:MAG: nicotinate (nicotinamide) nucleotide adenylyltransferase [Ruminococcus sp.]
MGRIGLFGGSFNPVHNGHLHLAQAAKDCLSLDRVILIPARVSPFKQGMGEIVSPEDRLEMCRLAAQTLPFCSVDDYELTQERVSYSFYTVRHFHALFPEDELVLLLGSDMLLSFQQWYRWQDILNLASLGVVSRASDDREILAQECERLLQYGKIFLCSAEAYTISSTKIRENIKNQKDFSCYLPKKVVQYIVSHQLYQ